MFTGLIQSVGTIDAVRRSGRDRQLTVRTAALTPDLELGDSIAVDGVCLTVVSISPGLFAADVSTESLDRTTLGSKGPGNRVNLEPALRLGDRLGGHLVTGHVDGLGTITDRNEDGNGTVFTVAAEPSIRPLIVEKGSITIDGISLTVNDVGTENFGVMVIPHTLKNTTLCDRLKGHRINIETDLVGKYVARLMGQRAETPPQNINLETLARNGFL